MFSHKGEPAMIEVLDVLSAGGVICYAPISGGLMLLNKAGKATEVQPSMTDFLKFRQEGAIVHTGTMGQGHHIFHGRVDFYKIKP